MKEGWHGDDYLVLFEPSEAASASDRYDISASLPGFVIVGLRGWDDFIVRNREGQQFTIPTVPLDAQYLAPFTLPEEFKLEQDARFVNKIKWYLRPIVFGGDPQVDENMIWVGHEQHAQLVRWWNNKYWQFLAARKASEVGRCDSEVNDEHKPLL